MSLRDEVRDLFRVWGGRGGRARARNLSAGDRSRIARRAARIRWRRADALYEFPGGVDLGEIAPKIIGGSMTAAAIRESMKLL